MTYIVCVCVLVCADMLVGLSDTEKHGQKTPLCRTPVSDMLHFAAQMLPVELPPVPDSAQHVSALQDQFQGGGDGGVEAIVYPPMPPAPHVDLVQQELQAQAEAGGGDATYGCYEAIQQCQAYSSLYNLHAYPASQQHAWAPHYDTGASTSLRHPSPGELPMPTPSMHESSTLPTEKPLAATPKTRSMVSTPPGLPSRNRSPVCPVTSPDLHGHHHHPQLPHTPNPSPAHSPGSPSKQGTPKRHRIAARFNMPPSPAHSHSGSATSE